jgi:hypothetical protein
MLTKTNSLPDLMDLFLTSGMEPATSLSGDRKVPLARASWQSATVFLAAC